LPFLIRRYEVGGKSSISIIDSGLKITGVFSYMGKLIVNGMIEGMVTGENLVIAEGGIVVAKVDVQSVSVGGRFEGELTAQDKVVILPTGVCSGKFLCKSLIVEDGGLINGDIKCANLESSTISKIADSFRF
jgi:cytoskeletal protein CcmA (bactofilin family)